MPSIAAGFSDPFAAGYGVRGSLLAQSAQVRDRLDTLTRQAGNGRVSDTYAGLGGGAATSLSLRPALTRIAAWQDNIAALEGRLQATQSSLSAISAIAADFRASTANLNGLSLTQVDSVAAGARDALRQVAGLLNARNGDQYVFAGQDSANPPIPQGEAILASGFVTEIATAVAGLGTNGAAATIAATLATASSNAPGTSPFSTALSQPASALAALRATAPVGEQSTISVGILASANADAVSAGGSTGSYARDILRSLATLGALNSSQVGQAGFAELVGDVRATLEGAITALNVDAGILGDRQAGIRASRQRLEETATVLQGQVADVEDVDMAETLSKLALTQTQLQSSYQLLAGLQSLSLTKFLSPA